MALVQFQPSPEDCSNLQGHSPPCVRIRGILIGGQLVRPLPTFDGQGYWRNDVRSTRQAVPLPIALITAGVARVNDALAHRTSILAWPQNGYENIVVGSCYLFDCGHVRLRSYEIILAEKRGL